MIAAMETKPDGSVTLIRPLGDPRFDQIFSGFYWQVTEPSGRLLRSRSLWDSTLPIMGNDTDLQVRRIAGPNGLPLLVAERDIQFPDATGPVHVMIAGDLREVSEAVHRFDLLLIISLGFLGLSLVVAILIQVRFGLKPLRKLATDLNAVREGERARLADQYPEEIAPLARAMNSVLDEDAELIERARRHIGNLAHGLKTPLAVIAAETTETPNVTLLNQQIQVMRRLIEHHLGRASAVAGAGGRLGVSTPVRSTANDITAVLRKVFAEKNLVIDVDIDPGVVFRGHREDLEEILGNLTENACKWATSQIHISATEDVKRLTLMVDDDGPGMSEEQAAVASRRGKRFDEIAPGWGLGLSIVSDLVEVNGGEIAFSRSPLGGLRVSIDLPRQ
ncbi:MAG: sensor histidine kinase, partial [Rhodospirillales bacterium]|nr:sensor histidine kinase [Rhodospirillales bacterium]